MVKGIERGRERGWVGDIAHSCGVVGGGTVVVRAVTGRSSIRSGVVVDFRRSYIYNDLRKLYAAYGGRGVSRFLSWHVECSLNWQALSLGMNMAFEPQAQKDST